MCRVRNCLEENFWWEVACCSPAFCREEVERTGVCTVLGEIGWLCPLHAARLHAVKWAPGTPAQLLQRRIHYTSFPYPCCRRLGGTGPVNLGRWAENGFGVRPLWLQLPLWLDLLLLLTPCFTDFGLYAKLLSTMCNIPTKLLGNS